MAKAFKIVLVEDNPIDIMILKKTFFNIHANCEFIEFDNGEEALKFLEKRRDSGADDLPDMVITDLHLPKMTGHDLLAIIKEDDHLKSIPVVMFSNSNAETDIKLAYHLNVNSYIVKPLSLPVYKETIRSFWNFWGNSVRLVDHNSLLKKAV